MSVYEIDRSWFRDVEAAGELVSLIDGDNRLVYVNDAESGSGDFIGEYFDSFVEPRDHDRFRAAVARTRETGTPQHFESRMAWPGAEASRDSNWVMALRGPAAEGLVAVIATDAGRQGRIEAELELSETTLRSLVDDSPDSILIADSERRILFVNRLEHGLESDDVLGQSAESFVPDRDRQKVIDAFDAVLSSGEGHTYETGLATPGGDREYTTRAVPIPSENGIKRVMLVATDITARVQAERETERLASQLQQAQKTESLGQLTGGVAHDFNNILIAISGNLELVRFADNDPAERAARIDDALDAVRRASTLTERLLAFSRKQTLRPRPTAIGDLVEGMRDLLERTLGEAIRVRVVSEDGVLPCKVDPGQLETAILNLAVNARDAMPDGGDLLIATVTAAVGEDDDVPLPRGDYPSIEVSDTGTGMTPEVAVQVFEPFFTTKDVGRGSGLGLSMVYGFVCQSGGHVTVQTRPGRGTTVRVLLQSTGEPVAAVVEPTAPETPVRGKDELVLVVEDDELVRSLTARVLVRLGYRTLVADRASAAMKLVEQHPEIAALVTDIVLPEGDDGFALAERARVERPGLPILYVSGYPRDVVALRGADTRIDSVLRKPYTTQRLAEAVSALIAG